MAMGNDWVEFWREHSCGHGCPLRLFNRVKKSESRNSKQIRMNPRFKCSKPGGKGEWRGIQIHRGRGFAPVTSQRVEATGEHPWNPAALWEGWQLLGV
jgi:hypothetical protein